MFADNLSQGVQDTFSQFLMAAKFQGLLILLGDVSENYPCRRLTVTLAACELTLIKQKPLNSPHFQRKTTFTFFLQGGIHGNPVNILLKTFLVSWFRKFLVSFGKT